MVRHNGTQGSAEGVAGLGVDPGDDAFMAEFVGAGRECRGRVLGVVETDAAFAAAEVGWGSCFSEGGADGVDG